MEVKTFGAQYELIEFNHYASHDEENPIEVLDVVIESNDVDFIEEEFSGLFVVDTKKESYVFSNYKPIEYYEVGSGLIRIICVK